MENTTDRRVRKTKKLLRQGLVELMAQKSIQNITVKELCAVCDINRGTFYLHYTDVFALLAAIEAELLAEFEEVLEALKPSAFGAKAPSPAMRSLFEFLSQNADMGKALLCNNADNVFLDRVKELVRVRVMAEWGAVFTRTGSVSYEYVYSFIVSGCIGMLQYWLEHDMPIPPEAMAVMMETILGKGVAALE